MKGKSIVSVAVAVLLGGCAHDRLAPADPSGAQTIGPKEVSILIDFGKIGPQPYTLLTTLRVGPRNGRLEVCGASQMLARVDLSDKIVSGLAAPGASLTLTSETGGLKVVLAPNFLPVTYKQSNDGKFKPNEFGPSAARCVVAQAPWDERWSNLKFHGKLAFRR